MPCPSFLSPSGGKRVYSPHHLMFYYTYFDEYLVLSPTDRGAERRDI
jgi:hypothetical protein